MTFRKVLFILCAVLFSLGSLFAADTGKSQRVALVIGNGSYTDKPLANPVNDAKDMAAVLEAAGFQVLLRTNVNLSGMEDALQAFSKALAGKNDALFYFAGHGVQVNSENYLLPVREDIRTEASVRSRAVSMGQVLETIRNSGVKTGIVLLDACRDNPFPGSSRSTSRGLTLVAAPRELETLIAYATEPGETAADGDGRNGVFTAALLRNLPVPGVSITDAMIRVRAEVKEETGDKQRPRTEIGLSRQFYIVDTNVRLQEEQARLLTTSTELDGINKALEEARKKLASSKTTAEKEKYESEQQKQIALQKAKEQEKASLQAEADRLRILQDRVRELAQQEASITSASIQRQKQLAEEAERKRKELNEAQAGDISNDPAYLVNRVEEARLALRDLEGQTQKSWSTVERDVNNYWDTKLAQLDTKPGKIETDLEFDARISKEKQTLAAGRAADLRARKAELDGTLSRDTTAMKATLEQRIQALESARFTQKSNTVSLDIRDYDRNKKSQSFVLGSKDPSFPWAGVLVKDFSRASNLLNEVETVELYAKSLALNGELTWRISFDRANERYLKILEHSTVKEIFNGTQVVSKSSSQIIGWFSPGKITAPIVGTLRVAASPSKSGKVRLNGNPVGQVPYEAKLAPGPYAIEIEWDGESERWNGAVQVVQDGLASITANPPQKYVPPSKPQASQDLDLGNGSLIGASLYWVGMEDLATATISSGGGLGVEAISEGTYFSMAGDIIPLSTINYQFNVTMDLGLALSDSDFTFALVPFLGLLTGRVDQDIPGTYNSKVGYYSTAYSNDTSAGSWFFGVSAGAKFRLSLDRETYLTFAVRYRFVDDITAWEDSDFTTLDSRYLTVPTYAVPPLLFEAHLGFQDID